MAITNGAEPQARRILRIRPRKQFWDLPREIRDMVYTYTLVEPTLWYRRHKPGCPFRVETQAFERPVFTCRPDREQQFHPIHWEGPESETVNIDDAEVRRKLCQGRPGLPLLRTCKKIYDEASFIFWDGNMFCFENSRQLHDMMDSIGWRTMNQIRSISHLEREEHNSWIDWCEHRWDVRWSFQNLYNLVELELAPARTLDWLGINSWAVLTSHPKHVPMPKLQQLRAVVLDRVPFNRSLNDEPSSSWIWYRVAKDLVPGPCINVLKHDFPDSPMLRPDCCFDCWARWPHSEGHDEWKRLWDPGYDPEVVNDVRSQLTETFRTSEAPSYEGRDPEPVDFGRPELNVGLLGLPINDATSRARARDSKNRENLLALRLRRQAGRPTSSNTKRAHYQEHAIVDIYDVEVAVPSTARRYTKRPQWEESDKLVTAQAEVCRRRQRREEVLELEKASAKREVEKAEEQVVESTKQLAQSKKAARRRVGH